MRTLTLLLLAIMAFSAENDGLNREEYDYWLRKPLKDHFDRCNKVINDYNEKIENAIAERNLKLKELSERTLEKLELMKEGKGTFVPSKLSDESTQAILDEKRLLKEMIKELEDEDPKKASAKKDLLVFVDKESDKEDEDDINDSAKFIFENKWKYGNFINQFIIENDDKCIVKIFRNGNLSERREWSISDKEDIDIVVKHMKHNNDIQYWKLDEDKKSVTVTRDNGTTFTWMIVK